MKKRYQYLSILILIILISSCSSTKNLVGKTDKRNTFSDEEIALIMQGDSLSPMRVFNINKKSDSILLSTKSTAVNLELNHPDKAGSPFEFYLNPRIIQYSKKKQEYREGCLSVPNRMDTLNSRSYAILIEYDKMDKTHHVEMVEDFTAVIFQHEIDHLNGVLYLQYLDKLLSGDALK